LGSHSSTAHAKNNCPPVISVSALKAYPDAKISGCKEETVAGKVQFAVKLVTKEAPKIELDLSAEGVVLQTKARETHLPPRVARPRDWSAR